MKGRTKPFEALKAAPRIVLTEPGQTADRLLGNALDPITEQMDREWQDSIRHIWTTSYEMAQKRQGQPAATDTGERRQGIPVHCTLDFSAADTAG
jgi:hypothetical protein